MHFTAIQGTVKYPIWKREPESAAVSVLEDRAAGGGGEGGADGEEEEERNYMMEKEDEFGVGE